MTAMGDLTAEKNHVQQVMEQRLAALKEDRVLSIVEKEQIVITGICSVFRYSAFIVDWSTTELDNITRSWLRAYKHTWSLPPGSDGSPMLLDKKDGGRGCPSAADLCTAEVLDMLEQCLGLPGEISQFTKQYLYIQCTNHGCKALNQLQKLISITGTAESPTELFLQRLNAQGLEISSPWGDNLAGEQLILEAVWQDVYKAWSDKERWAGCQEMDDCVRDAWASAKHCLHACRKLGQAVPAILTVSQLRGSQAKWLHTTELKHRHCDMTKDEITALVQYLSQAENRQELLSQPQNPASQSTVASPPTSQSLCTSSLAMIQPFIMGHVKEVVPHGHVILQRNLSAVPQLPVQAIPDEQLAAFMCQNRAIFSLPYTANDCHVVECLLPLRRIVLPYRYQAEYIIARLTTDDTAPLTVLPMVLVRDSLLGAGCESLPAACSRPPWRVSQQDRFAGYLIPSSNNASLNWHLCSGGAGGQQTIAGLTQYFSKSNRRRIPSPLAPRYPWQMGVTLPCSVTIDLSQHQPTQLPCHQW